MSSSWSFLQSLVELIFYGDTETLSPAHQVNIFIIPLNTFTHSLFDSLIRSVSVIGIHLFSQLSVVKIIIHLLIYIYQYAHAVPLLCWIQLKSLSIISANSHIELIKFH